MSQESNARGELLKPEQVAKILQVTVGTLEQWRCHRKGPAFQKLGPSKRAPVRYYESDVQAYIGGGTETVAAQG